jgi:hypothetical protein
MANLFQKPITSAISTRQESATFYQLSLSSVTYTLCDRTDTSSAEANYFVSLNLPYTESAFGSGSTLALSNPELLQLNVDNIVIIPIPREYYSELIDGRSITFTVPQLSGLTAISAKTVVSSTYSAPLQKRQSDPVLGSNLCFLFCDEINLPYTGTTNDGSDISRVNNTTWDVTPYTNRPAALQYSDIVFGNQVNQDFNSDGRPASAITFAYSVSNQYPTNYNNNNWNSPLGYNYDIPVGFVALDKGIIVLTHPAIVNNIPWDQGYELYTNAANVGAGTTDIYFNDANNSSVDYYDTNISYRNSYVCLALPAEFYFTNNPSWNLQANVNELVNGTNNFDPTYVTQVGLYNLNGEMIAVAKLSEPVEKNYTNLITFNLDINI